ncbi:tetratricopeptide repeat protein [Flavivirga abyssicola]|uniref:tetratricopeptide repeat protein n=1 Tax=Flavivirga abyssicola TaxID=3063533 RepID=UPI0026DEC70E|nr:tetratricopeptide repeat protein [Flavivirga sp. MEBiC07777]WVK14297.1 tetratricopeptide repeat protein [Flavivirga sp. MEBiC07777]
MKYITFSFLFFCLGVSGFSNTIINSQQIDSLNYFFHMANSPKTDSCLTKAYIYFEQEKKKSIASNNIMSAIYHLRQIAIIQNELGDYFGGEVSVVEALKLLESVKESEDVVNHKVGLYNQLGRIYMALLDYDEAIKYYDKGLKIAKLEKDINIIQNNKALVYIQLHKYELAENEFLKVYENSLLQDDKKQLSRALDNLGFVQSKLNKSEGLEKLMMALEQRKAINDSPGIYASYKHLVEVYKDRKDLKKATNYAHKGYEMAKNINSPSFIKDALSRLIDLNQDSNIVEYVKIVDSMSLAKQRQENKYAKMKYDYTEKEKIAKENELAKEKEKSLKILYRSIAGLILLSSIFLIIILKSKHKKDNIKKVYFAETRMSKKVHDELANDMSDVISFIENSLEAPTDKKTVLLNNLEDLYIRTRDISTQTASIDLINFSESLKHLLIQHKRKETKIITNNIDAINWSKVSGHKKMAVFRSIQELLVNMKKHSQAKVVSIVFKEHHRKKEIVYSDDGIGVSVKDVKLNGLLNVESRIKSIGGSFNFTTSKGNGFKAILKFNS